LGAHRNGKLRYFGHSGSGFTEKGLKEAVERLKPFFTDKSPCENPPRIPEKIQWVKPALVCEVAFAEQIRQIMLSEKLSESEKLDRLHALILLEVFEIDNLNQATPAQLKRLKDGLAITQAMQQIRRAELLAKEANQEQAPTGGNNE
jgi:bifunctional non-homologous end joining protein LigD